MSKEYNRGYKRNAEKVHDNPRISLAEYCCFDLGLARRLSM